MNRLQIIYLKCFIFYFSGLRTPVNVFAQGLSMQETENGAPIFIHFIEKWF